MRPSTAAQPRRSGVLVSFVVYVRPRRFTGFDDKGIALRSLVVIVLCLVLFG